MSGEVYGRRYALLVGMEYYGPESSLNSLPGVALDVEGMAAVLERHRDGTSNFDVEELVSIDGVPVTSEDLLRAVDEMLEELTSDDHFLLYFSGHAVLGPFGFQLATAEKAGPLDSGVYFDALMHRINRAACITTILLDCCDAGGAGDREIVLEGNLLVMTEIREDVTVLASCARDEASRMLPGQMSYYTAAVVSVLSGDFASAGGAEIDALGLHAHTRDMVENQSPRFRTFGRHGVLRRV